MAKRKKKTKQKAPKLGLPHALVALELEEVKPEPDTDDERLVAWANTAANNLQRAMETMKGRGLDVTLSLGTPAALRDNAGCDWRYDLGEILALRVVKSWPVLGVAEPS